MHEYDKAIKKLKKVNAVQVIGNIHITGLSQRKKRDTIKQALKPQGYSLNGKFFTK